MRKEIYYSRERGPLEDVIEWAKSFENEDRVVAQTRHKERGREFVLSTVFLGIDHNFGAGPPLLYETMVFDLKPPAWNAVVADGWDGDECVRHTTEQEAVEGHDPWKMTSPGTPRDILKVLVEALR